MKKTYTTPTVEIISVESASMLAASTENSFQVNGGGSKGPSGFMDADDGSDESDSRHMGFGKRLWEE